MVVAMELPYTAFILLKHVPLITGFWSFYHKWLFDLVKCFSHTYRDDHMIFIFAFVNLLFHFNWFSDVEPSLHPKINCTLKWCMIHLCIVGFSLLIVHWIFLQMLIKFLFLRYPCLVLKPAYCFLHKLSLEDFLPLQFFLEKLKKIHIRLYIYIYTYIHIYIYIYIIEFASEVFWSSSFSCWEILDYSFNLFLSKWSI